MLDALGATVPPGATGPLTADLTGALPGDQAVQWNRIGSYTVTVSDTSSSDALTPATATIEVVRSGVTTVTLADPTPTFQVTGTPPDAAAVLLAMGASIVNGDGEPTVDLTGSVSGDQPVSFDKPGVYQVTVGDTVAADAASPVTATIRIVPVSVVTADTTAYFNTSHPPTPASVLSASGARITDGDGNTVSGSLSATVPNGCGATAGSCTATITGTDMYGFDTAPVTVELDISAAAVSVAHDTATFTATGSAPSQASLVRALGATVKDSSAGGTPVVHTSKVDWSVPGTYPVTVADSEEHDAADTVDASIRVVPVPFVTLPSPTVYVPVSAARPLAATTLLADAGATLTDVYGNAIHGTLSADTSAVNGSVAGTYPATITGTDDYGFASSPAKVTVVIYLSALQPGTVSITGTPRVGATLTATPAGWAELSDPEYQWLRDGVEIPGATGPTYTVTRADAGRTLSVRMTESPEWYSTASAISNAVTIPKGRATKRTRAPKLASASYRSGSLRLKVKVTRKGTLTARITRKAGRRKITLAARKVPVRKAGIVSTSMKLSRAARSRIRRRSVRTTVTITFRPSAKGARTVSSHRTLIINKGGHVRV